MVSILKQVHQQILCSVQAFPFSRFSRIRKQCIFMTAGPYQLQQAVRTAVHMIIQVEAAAGCSSKIQYRMYRREPHTDFPALYPPELHAHGYTVSSRLMALHRILTVRQTVSSLHSASMFQTTDCSIIHYSTAREQNCSTADTGAIFRRHSYSEPVCTFWKSLNCRPDSVI